LFRNRVVSKNSVSKWLTAPFLLISLILLLIFVLGLNADNAATAAGIANTTSSLDEQVFLPLIRHRHDPHLGTPIFGVQMYGNTTWSSPYRSDLNESGASWVRAEVYWDYSEPDNRTPDAYRWHWTDQILAAAINENIHMVGTVRKAPSWAAPDEDAPIYPENLADFAEYMGALVERYDGDGVDDAPYHPVIHHWEIYNEPDAGPRPDLNRWGDAGAEYAQMLQTIYPAVKAANPEAQILLGGLAYDWFDSAGGPFIRSFLDDVLASGGGDYFDVMNFHAYSRNAGAWTNQGVGIIEKTAYIREKLKSYGLEKPIFITESGEHSNNLFGQPSSQEQQNRTVVEVFTQAMAADVEALMWFSLADSPAPYLYQNGLITLGNVPIRKSSFDVYVNTANLLGKTHYVRTFGTDETGTSEMEVYQFQDNINNRTIYVAWLNPMMTEATQPLVLEAGRATLIDLLGSSTSVKDGDDEITDGKIQISVGGEPLYVVVPQ